MSKNRLPPTPNFTGASLVGADAARDLVPHWQIRDRPVDRGPLPPPLGIMLAVIAGLLAAGVAGLFAVQRPGKRSSCETLLGLLASRY